MVTSEAQWPLARMWLLAVFSPPTPSPVAVRPWHRRPYHTSSTRRSTLLPMWLTSVINVSILTYSSLLTSLSPSCSISLPPSLSLSLSLHLSPSPSSSCSLGPLLPPHLHTPILVLAFPSLNCFFQYLIISMNSTTCHCSVHATYHSSSASCTIVSPRYP